jgi:predicted GH43/DUF377 family glycosyl hydrolase
MIERSNWNPILTPRSDLWWANRKTYNCGAVFDDGEYQLIFRAVGDDSISRLGSARSANGVTLTVKPVPVFSPVESWEARGCEDPRITKVDDAFWMLYTAFDGRTARCAITSTTDFITWSDRHLILPDWHEGRWNQPGDRPIMLPGFDVSSWRPQDANWSKAAALFPEKIGDKYWIYFGDDQIWAASSTNLVDWSVTRQPVIETRPGLFDSAYVEMGPPPIRVSAGWLILYHGTNRLDRGRIYRLGAAIVGEYDPLRVIDRLDAPLLEPQETYEIAGSIDVVDGLDSPHPVVDGADAYAYGGEDQTPRAIFCCGAVQRGSSVNLYYSGGDTVLCLAEMNQQRRAAKFGCGEAS